MSKPSIQSPFANAIAFAAKQKKPGVPAPYSIRFTPAERAQLAREAGGNPLSVHIRKKLFGDGVVSRKGLSRKPKIDDAALAKVLSALGQSRLTSNMNQLAKAANTGRLSLKSETEQELIRACAEIAEMRLALMKALGLRME